MTAIDLTAETLAVSSGDLLLVRVPSDADYRSIASAIEGLIAKLPGGVCVVAVGEGFDVQRLTADDMRRIGWVRAH